MYTSGVDQRITQFVKLAGDPPKWVQTTQRRIHSHDVRALAIYPPYAGTATHDDSEIYAPLLFSAGLDMSVAVMPTVPAHAEAEETLSSGPSTFEDGLPKRIGYPISSGNAVLASQARMVLSFSARAVGIWTLPDQPARPDDDLDDGPSGDGGWSKALEMELRFRTNITAGAISPDGRWLAIADVWEVKLFWVDNVSLAYSALLALTYLCGVDKGDTATPKITNNHTSLVHRAVLAHWRLGTNIYPRLAAFGRCNMGQRPYRAPRSRRTCAGRRRTRL